MKRHKRRIVFAIVFAAMFSFVPLAVLAEETDAAQGNGMTKQSEVKTVHAPALYSEADNEELLVEYMENEVSSEPRYSFYGYTHLTGLDKTMYEVLRRKLEDVANGSTTSSVITVSVAELGLNRPFTAAQLGLKTVMSGDSPSEEAKTALLGILKSIDASKLHNALLFDCPASLYWYDKNKGSLYGYSYAVKKVKDSATGEPAVAFVDATAYTFSFYVAAEFSASQQTGTCETDEEKIRSVQSAIETAQGIVEENAGLSDTGKLQKYKEIICEKVSYNHYAAKKSNNVPYGNPWQLIWVFDDDPETNVVCEGYAKAFQFLCDVSRFQDPNVQSRIVTGEMDNGGHMWNVLTAGNGKNYLVDVTNCDEGTIGKPNKLFLVPYTEKSDENTYHFSCGNRAVTYEYDEDTLGFYNAEELGITHDSYMSCEGEHMEVTDEAVPATCTEAGLTEGKHCAVCGAVLVAQKPVPAGHTEETDKAVPATCTETGLTEGKHCKVCGAVLVAQKPVPAGHTVVKDPAVPATCTETGLTEGSHCAVCGAVLVAQKVIPKKPVSNGAHVLLSGQAFLVTKTARGGAQGTVTYTKANNAKSVTVPKTVKLPDGKTYQVTTIAASAFTGSKIRTVTIPENVKKLCAGAFKGSRASTLIVKTKRLTKSSIKKCLKGSRVKTVRVKIGSKKTNKKYVKKYKKIFTKKNAGKAVKIK